jgi:hypothetical protein
MILLLNSKSLENKRQRRTKQRIPQKKGNVNDKTSQGNFLQPNEKGMPTDLEAEVLNEIDDAMVATVVSQLGGIQAGRVTTKGERSSYFYIGKQDVDYEKTFAKLLTDYPDYIFAYGSLEDPEWKCYLDFLYPAPIQLRSIMNGWVVRRLVKLGDSLTAPRPVAHWIYFRTQQDREAYWNVVNAKGFELVDMATDEDNSSEYPFSLWITRDDKVDLESIDECVLPLWELASEHKGKYDGWETGVAST